MKLEHLVRQMDFRSEERKNQIADRDKQDTSSATGALTYRVFSESESAFPGTEMKLFSLFY